MKKRAEPLSYLQKIIKPASIHRRKFHHPWMQKRKKKQSARKQIDLPFYPVGSDFPRWRLKNTKLQYPVFVFLSIVKKECTGRKKKKKWPPCALVYVTGLTERRYVKRAPSPVKLVTSDEDNDDNDDNTMVGKFERKRYANIVATGGGGI